MHDEALTFAEALARFRACAESYAFELNQEAIERALATDLAADAAQPEQPA